MADVDTMAIRIKKLEDWKASIDPMLAAMMVDWEQYQADKANRAAAGLPEDDPDNDLETGETPERRAEREQEEQEFAANQLAEPLRIAAEQQRIAAAGKAKQEGADRNTGQNRPKGPDHHVGASGVDHFGDTNKVIGDPLPGTQSIPRTRPNPEQVDPQNDPPGGGIRNPKVGAGETATGVASEVQQNPDQPKDIAGVGMDTTRTRGPDDVNEGRAPLSNGPPPNTAQPQLATDPNPPRGGATPGNTSRP